MYNINEYEYAKKVEDGWLLYQGKTLKGKLTFTKYSNNYGSFADIRTDDEEKYAEARERVQSAIGQAVKPKEAENTEEKSKDPLADTRAKYAPLGDCKEDRMNVAIKYGLVRYKNHAYELTEKCKNSYKVDSFMKYLHGEIEKAERIDVKREKEIQSLLDL